ncbi:hypothetical protein Ga0466249_005326 [Sporomusaceae bacterium BoRhaA]|uniref:DUF4489 domain-containing protein n=1 Tax=Pelorhabdus rhamnosifermentans TaxID=2772457 RepID=UPI001C05FAD5|nr:DUF4489 domain-containing protein [Pelorhabdus rhamnosifermentans]MBU2704172.1 hypothetical protein [Pelorhabdus rhamnosifermentans]
MDSMSKPNGKDNLENNRYPKSGLTLLKCGIPGTASITIPATGGTPLAVTVASLTTNISCFCNPCIKLEFASNVTVPTANSVTLNFQVFKLCNNQYQAIAVGPKWVFARSLDVALTPYSGSVSLATTDTVSFFVCDCCDCPSKCCTYTVVVTPEIDGAVSTVVNITNATLSAIAVDSVNQCCNAPRSQDTDLKI